MAVAIIEINMVGSDGRGSDQLYGRTFKQFGIAYGPGT
jgi:hypothetical protein